MNDEQLRHWIKIIPNDEATLPPLDASVWLCDDETMWLGGRSSIDGGWWEAYDSPWMMRRSDDCDGVDECEPTHWQELPAWPERLAMCDQKEGS